MLLTSCEFTRHLLYAHHRNNLVCYVTLCLKLCKLRICKINTGILGGFSGGDRAKGERVSGISKKKKLLRNLHCCSVFYIPEKDNSPQCCLHPIDQVCYVTTAECVLAIFAMLCSTGCRSIPDYITSYTAYSGRMAQDTAPDTITQGAILGLEGGTSAVLARTNKVFSYNLIAPLTPTVC